MSHNNILRLLNEGEPADRRFVIAMTGVAGLANAGLVGLINHAAERLWSGVDIGPRLIVVYALVLTLFLLTNRASLLFANRFVQRRIEATRRRLVRKVARADLRTLERLGEADIHVTVSQETDQLAQTLPLLIGAAQSGFLLLFLLLYIATLSLISFVLVAGFTLFAMYFFINRQNALAASMVDVHHREADMLATLSHFTLGFQEIRLNADKNDALFAHFEIRARQLQDTVMGLGARWVALLQFSNAFIFLLVGMVVFVLPIFFSGYTDTIYKIVGATVFALGPFAAMMSVVRLIGRAEAGLGHLYALERRLVDPAPRAAPTADSPVAFGGFTTIALDGVVFHYVDETGAVPFTAGPLDLSLNRGEILFLTGGNGTGKSTALKLLCGLYRPDAGRILCDDKPVTPDQIDAYRGLFSVIFTDFHLFDRLYGLEDVDPTEVSRLIARMELTDKVEYRDGRFTTRDLSTGQRKRLALIVALLEDREIYVLDEWAADQDAHFRHLFYTELLPGLKARGKTVLAVTHDDRYWDCCDRRLELDLGMVLPAPEVNDGAG
ncbi:cyclic peptide export ABC transporter [Oceaniovalibus sp. ACAM 378]|uniref:cyclic peptide export ABC transporter n=1 Tax=Oceaniovalibus sp. ACAM 378 TaxID=2599923 RepID=UPI0011DB9E18|nr:cyclic peptide export ABC transporter [Oceaniovalibus sp. ACAM 378]TYB89463.1 cyclic peptide export ABC transporter [Oceaniovalibus sp. ACAM 378]